VAPEESLGVGVLVISVNTQGMLLDDGAGEIETSVLIPVTTTPFIKVGVREQHHRRNRDCAQSISVGHRRLPGGAYILARGVGECPPMPAAYRAS